MKKSQFMLKQVVSSAFCLFLVGACFAATAWAEDKKPVNLRAVGGSVMGGTWNVAFTGLGKLLDDRYPGSSFNVLQGASTSNPLRLENNSGDITCTQSFNIFAGMKGSEPYKAPFKNVTSIANIADTTYMHVIVAQSVPVNSFDELMEKKIPIRLDKGAKGTLHEILGSMYLAEYGYTYEDIVKWGGSFSAVSANDRIGMLQDGTLTAVFMVGSAENAHFQEMVLNAKIKWLPVSEKVLKSVSEKTGLPLGVLPAGLHNGTISVDTPCLTDTVHMIVRKDVSEEDVYKMTKTLAEEYKYMQEVQPAWKTLDPASMPTGLVAPMHPGAERYYREAGLIQ